MRILIFEQRFTTPFEPGISRFYYFIKVWLRSNHKITLITGCLNYFSGRKEDILFKEKGLKVIRIWDKTFGYFLFWGRLFSYLAYFVLSFLRGLFVRKPDLIIVSSPPIFVGLVGYFLSFLKRTKFVFEVRDLWPDEVVALGFLKNKFLIKLAYFLESFLYEKADLIVVNSPGLKDFLVKNKNLSGGKIFCIFNPIDKEMFLRLENRSLREKLGWTNKIVLIYSGSFSAVYDFDLLLEVAKDFLFDKRILFVFLGDGRQKERIKKRVMMEKIDNVLFFDAVSKFENADFIFASDIGLASLKDIEFLNYVYVTKVFDYLASGRPVVLAVKGVTQELIEKQSQSGFCVLPNDKESFKKALLKLIDDSLQREKMGQRGRDYIFYHFDYQKLANGYLKILEELVKN